MQVNRYETRQEYSDDKSRSALKSAVSLIVESSSTVYDGRNCLTYDRRSAGIGDLVVYDRSMASVGFVKADTLHFLTLPGSLVPVGVVVERLPERLLVTSLKDMTWNGSKTIMWGHSYEAAISGLPLDAGGVLGVTVSSSGKEETASAEYPAGASLADVAKLINTGFTKLTDSNNRGWKAAADSDRIILYSNSVNVVAVVSVTGADIVAADTFHPLAEYAYLAKTESVRRNNRAMSNFAGASRDKFIDHYSQNGSTPTLNVPLGSTTVVKREAFETSAFCQSLRERYASYEDYLIGEHFLQYPTMSGAGARDGRATSALLASRIGTEVRGGDEPLYPPAWTCATYGVSVEGHTTGFEPGNWWLPSATEMMLMLRDRAVSADLAGNDPVNRTIAQAAGDGIYGNQSRWTCCECDPGSAFCMAGSYGYVGASLKSYSYHVRPLSALEI